MRQSQNLSKKFLPQLAPTLQSQMMENLEDNELTPLI